MERRPSVTELFAEFNISPNEVAPWEGGRPTDIQAIVDFKIRSVGVVLTNNATSILRCVTGEACLSLRHAEGIPAAVGVHG